MKPIFIVTLLLVSSCKQYQPKATVPQSALGSVASLAASDCKNKNVVYITSEPSSVTWTILQTNGGAEPIEVKSPASGTMELTKGLLNQMKGLIIFDVVATSTKDPIRQRVFQEALLGLSNNSPFRLRLESLSGAATAVANGATVEMKAYGELLIDGRISPIAMPVKFTEKDGAYIMKSEPVSVNVRQTRPGINAVDLSDKLKNVEAALSIKLGGTIDFDFEINFKNNCAVK